MSRKDGRGRQMSIGLAALVLLAIAVTAAVVGATPAAPAQASPSAPVALGIAERVAETPKNDPAASSKIPDPEAATSHAKAALSEPLALKKAYIAPPRVHSASSRSSAGSSGWRTARVSWYGPGFYGNTMAGGGTLQPNSMVVAHRSLPFGTRIQFEYKGRTCTAVVRDRGPYVGGRIFDLGPGTAKALGFSGVGTVRYRILGR